MHRFVLAGLLSVVLATASGAQQAFIDTLTEDTVTEDEFLAAVDGAHPAVAASGEEFALARARVIEAETLDNPRISVEREALNGNSEQTEILLSWQLPDRARRARIESLEASARAEKAQLAQRLSGIRLELRRIYADWALAMAREQRLCAQAERVVALAERQAARAERGESSGLEAQRLQLTAQALEARVALAAADHERARAEALRWLPTLPEDVRPALPERPFAPATVQVEGTDDHPLVRAAAAEVAAARLELDAAGHFVTSPELSLGWQRQESGAESVSGPLFGASWSLPLFDRRQAERVTAEARLVGASARLELLRRRQFADRRGALASFDQLTQAVDQATIGRADSARMLDGAEAAFKLGEASLTDLLDSHRVVTDAALVELDLYAAALAAHRHLERLAAHPSNDPSVPLHLDLETSP